MAVEQVLMGTIKPLPYQIFLLKKDTKDCQNGQAQSRTWQRFHWISEFFFLPNSVSDVCIFCLAILSPNLSGLFMHSLMQFIFAISPLTFSHFVKTVLCLTMQRVAILYNLALPAWSNVFIIAHRRSITLFNSVLLFTITPCRRYCDTCKSSSSNSSSKKMRLGRELSSRN